MNRLTVALVETSETARAVPGWVRRALADGSVDLIVRGCENRADLQQHASECDVLWLWGSRVLTGDDLDVLTRCGAILRSGSGTDNVPVAEATERRILVANTPGAVAQEVADHAIALLLSIVRQIAAQDRLMRSGVWEFRRENNRWHLRGSVLGFIGFGRIAELVAESMKPFGVHMLAHDPWVADQHMSSRGVQSVGFATLLSQSDFITIHCPLTAATHHLIGEKEIQMMKAHAILINTSRGAIVDEAALVRALREKRIGGAGLDVFEHEPLPPASPLLKLENVVVTPHIAGYSDLFPQSFWRYSVESLLALAKGHWPRAVVNPEVIPKWPLVRRDWPVVPETYEEREEAADHASTLH
jgi:D-3-phosphoglycerate dehydrogenase / 2-oxoglutarate reductase